MKYPSIFLSIVAAVTMTFGPSTSSVQAVCPPDFNGNNIVDGPDLAILLTAWNSSSSQYDLDNDGIINGADLAVLIGHWGPCGFGGPLLGNKLVINPNQLNLPVNWSAYVVGWANTKGGCIDLPAPPHCYNFQVLQQTSADPNNIEATFNEVVEPGVSSGHVTPIKIWGNTGTGGIHWGNTTITTGSATLSGGQLQILICPPDTVPSSQGFAWNVVPPCNAGNGTAAQCIGVTAIPGPPLISNSDEKMLIDIVEFTYLDVGNSAWDLSAVTGLTIPMTMTVTGHDGVEIGSVGIHSGITRKDISEAYNHFMDLETVPNPNPFRQLLYWSGGVYSCLATNPPDIDGQFFSIVGPYQWLTTVPSSCYPNPPIGFFQLFTYWDSAINDFFSPDKTLKLVASTDSLVEYTGVCNSAGTAYTFTGDATDNHGIPINPAFTFTLNKPVVGADADIHNNSASFVFGNCLPPGVAFPSGDAAQIVNSIMEALSRGVALDGFCPPPINIISATSTGFYQPPANIDPNTNICTLPNPLGVARITTSTPHGIPSIAIPGGISYRANIKNITIDSPNGIGVPSVQHYNGVVPTSGEVISGYLNGSMLIPCEIKNPICHYPCETALKYLTPTTFQFHYPLDSESAQGIQGTENYSIISGAWIPVVGTNGLVELTLAPRTSQNHPQRLPVVGEYVLISDAAAACGSGCGAQLDSFNTTFTVVGSTLPNKFTINVGPNPLPTGLAGGLCWMLNAPGSGGTLTPYGASTIAWNNVENWYGAPNNNLHVPQKYNTFSKFVHYSTIEGKDSRKLGNGRSIFKQNQAYGFSLDENPTGPYSGGDVAAKLETVPQGSTITLTLTPFLPTTP